tara:strand:+ start:792 stop:1562 length:771 start_codon:yes stop_codon:yes gene_type:complete
VVKRRIRTTSRITQQYRPASEGDAPKGAIAVLLACIAGSLALRHIPGVQWVWWPLMLLSTLVHELGHGLAAVIVGGDFVSLQMYADGSGVAATAHSGSRSAGAIIAAGGLVGPASVACGLFLAARTERRARIAMGVLAGVLVAVTMLVVRNLFGVAFVLAFSGLLVAIVQFGSTWVARFGLVFLAVQLALSVFSRGDYLFTPVARTGAGNMPSDVAQIADAFLLPYWVWGGLCGLFSVAVLVLGIRLFLRPMKAMT